MFKSILLINGKVPVQIGIFHAMGITGIPWMMGPSHAVGAADGHEGLNPGKIGGPDLRSFGGQFLVRRHRGRGPKRRFNIESCFLGNGQITEGEFPPNPVGKGKKQQRRNYQEKRFIHSAPNRELYPTFWVGNENIFHPFSIKRFVKNTLL